MPLLDVPLRPCPAPPAPATGAAAAAAATDAAAAATAASDDAAAAAAGGATGGATAGAGALGATSGVTASGAAAGAGAGSGRPTSAAATSGGMGSAAAVAAAWTPPLASACRPRAGSTVRRRWWLSLRTRVLLCPTRQSSPDDRSQPLPLALLHIPTSLFCPPTHPPRRPLPLHLHPGRAHQRRRRRRGAALRGRRGAALGADHHLRLGADGWVGRQEEGGAAGGWGGGWDGVRGQLGGRWDQQCGLLPNLSCQQLPGTPVVLIATTPPHVLPSPDTARALQPAWTTTWMLSPTPMSPTAPPPPPCASRCACPPARRRARVVGRGAACISNQSECSARFTKRHNSAPPLAALPLPQLQGLPEDAQEGDLRALFEPVGGVAGVRLLRDGGGRGGGQAFMVGGWSGGRHERFQGRFLRGCLETCDTNPPPSPPAPAPNQHPSRQDFESAEAAAALMGSDWRDQTFFGPHRLRFEYARPRSAAAAHGDDWECEACQAANFGRWGRVRFAVPCCVFVPALWFGLAISQLHPPTVPHPPARPSPLPQAAAVLPVRPGAHPRRAPCARRGAALVHPAHGRPAAGHRRRDAALCFCAPRARWVGGWVGL